MAQRQTGIFGDEQNSSTVKELLSRYLRKWPLFLICLLICVGAGIFYIQYTVPKYIATTLLLVKGGESGSSNSGDLIEAALTAKREVNLNNEMILIRADSLMSRTVAKNGFNITYYKKGPLLEREIYEDAPFSLVPNKLSDSNSTYSIYLQTLDATGGQFIFGTPKLEKLYPFKWGVPFTFNGQSFVLNAKRKFRAGDGSYIARWQPVNVAAAGLSANLTVKEYNSETSVIELSLKTENLQKGIDVLDALFAEFYSSDIDDRSRLSETTVAFIDDRLLKISEELQGVEDTLEDLQGTKNLIDIKGQSTQSLEDVNSVSKTIKDLAIQQGIVSMVLDYFARSANNGKLVPSSLGLNDGTLASLITQYNDLQLKREREAPLVAPNSTVMQDLNTQLANLKSSILESLNNISKNLRLQEGGLQQQSSKYKSFLSSVPHDERVLLEIKRKQGITEGLYLYLLQKREEAAISSTSSKVAHYVQVDPAKGYGPVEPDKRNIILYSALLGLVLAFGLIYTRDILYDKIRTKAEVTSRVSVPFIGEINHIASRKKQAIPVLERGIVSEQFRSLRTNLSFLSKNGNSKTIMVTSSVSGDGKSFISLNLASVCAIPGKKVALLEFDIRNPVINDHLYIDNTRGLTDFIVGKVNDISGIFRVLEEIPSLHIYPCGPLPDNPADLLLSDRIPLLLDSLKKAYDYVIIDAAPAGLVTDPVILGKYSDIVLYVIRQQSTLKKHLEFINENVINKTLNNIFLVLNDVRSSDKAKYKKYYN